MTTQVADLNVQVHHSPEANTHSPLDRREPEQVVLKFAIAASVGILEQCGL